LENGLHLTNLTDAAVFAEKGGSFEVEGDAITSHFVRKRETTQL
jgi:hypothetical protein